MGLSRRENTVTIHRLPHRMNMAACTHGFPRALRSIGLALLLALLPAWVTLAADAVTIGNLTYVNKELVGVGRVPADLRDKFGETFGSASGMATDSKSWMLTPAGYQGTFYVLPDRGYNVGGTTDYRARLNDNAQLSKFGLHNGEPNDRNNLSEKWEGMALVPALDPANPRDFFLFVTNDNDFITQNGYQVGAAYRDASGADVDTMFLVYRIMLLEQRK